MEVLIIGGGIGGLTLGLMLHRAGIRLPHLRGGARTQGRRRRHQHSAACDARIVRARTGGGAREVAVTTREYCFFNRFGQFIYNEPAGRSAGYDVAAILDPSRRSAPGAARRVRRARRAPTRVTGWRCTRVEQDGPEASRISWTSTAGRCRRSAARVDRLRRHPFGDAQAALSRRRAADLFRRQHVARRHALEAVSLRRQHDPRRLAHPARS